MWRARNSAPVAVFVAMVLIGFFLAGRGLGGALRPGGVYVPIRITHVRVDSIGGGWGGVQVVSNQPGEYGCTIKDNMCDCDSPYGRVVFPLFVECDVARLALYYDKEGE